MQQSRNHSTEGRLADSLNTRLAFLPRLVYLLPSKWSLYYSTSAKWWSAFRERVKRSNPQWQVCSCPQRRTASQLHEGWACSRRSHTKRLVGVTFLCARCHGPTNEGWLPVGPFNLDTFLGGRLDLSDDMLLPLRRRSYIDQTAETRRRANWKRAAARLGRTLRGARECRVQLVPYRIDLSALKRFEYSAREIADLQRLAMVQAERRIQALVGRLSMPQQRILLYEQDIPREEQTRGRVAFSMSETGLFTP